MGPSVAAATPERGVDHSDEANKRKSRLEACRAARLEV